jgi:hypothetical protein
VCPGRETSMIYFSYSGGHNADPTKKCVGTCHAELVFLHPGGYVGHIVRSVAPGARNVDALVFKLRWAQCESHKKRIRTHHA